MNGQKHQECKIVRVENGWLITANHSTAEPAQYVARTLDEVAEVVKSILSEPKP